MNSESNPKLITDKKICIIGSGGSISKYSIDFNQYDTIVGINRIYKTNVSEYYDILYHNGCLYDWISSDHILKYNSMKIKELIFLPVNLPKFKTLLPQLKKLLSENTHNFNVVCDLNYRQKIFITHHTRLITGLNVLFHILYNKPKSISIYGFDFYKTDYYQLNKPNRFLSGHNIQECENLFNTILVNNSNIFHYK